MLLQHTHPKKLSFITIVLLISLSFLSSISVWGKPPPKPPKDGTLIGPAGGIVDAGHNSYLLVPEGALTEEITIYAKSEDSAIATDPVAIEQSLQNAITLIQDQLSYIQALPKKDDSSGEWILANAKNWLEHRNGIILEQSQDVLAKHQASYGWEALRKILHSVKSVDEFEWELDFQAGKVGLTSDAILRQMCDQIRLSLQQADELYESALLFQFEPHGTQFLIDAELIIPLEEISITDDFAWYSGDGGATIEILASDYFVDEVKGTVHYFVPHFSEYYYQRR